MFERNDSILSNTFENFALLSKFKSIDLIVKFKVLSEKSKFASCALNEKINEMFEFEIRSKNCKTKKNFEFLKFESNLLNFFSRQQQLT